MKIVKPSALDKSFFEYQEIKEIASVRTIIDAVQKDGDAAVKKYTEQFDGVKLKQLRVPDVDLENAFDEIDDSVKATLKAAADKIRRFARKQKEQMQDFEFEIQHGVFTGQKVVPINRVAVYTPGGGYPLPSSVLMGAIPAKVAGVKEIALCSPPTTNGKIHPAILAAAYICEVKEVYQIGGVQAVAAMAYGTETIAPVDKIVGPGNQYVTAAKRMVFGRVGIDFIAGPSEVLIIADDSANPAFVAADLLAQAEHDPQAVPILITPSEALAKAVNKEIDSQLKRLATAAIAKQSVDNHGVIIHTASIDEAIDIANRRAPEHLELHVEHAEAHANHLRNYGSLFIGSYSAEVLGDYSSGLNHTLPTNTCARYTGGLSVLDFLKVQTTLRVNKDGINSIGLVARHLGEIEGLVGHANAAALRLEGVGKNG
ncbi:histidinol dehydrogenase [candidate division KSB1 bacterium]|nr:histidinol dehydrogenase [candidate division KSB1 bacterium]